MRVSSAAVGSRRRGPRGDTGPVPVPSCAPKDQPTAALNVRAEHSCSPQRGRPPEPDTTYLKQREGGRIVSVAAIIAVAANTEGKREIVGLHLGPLEAETFWAAFLKSMARRGLRGVKLVVSDAHEGLKAAIRRVVGRLVAALPVGARDLPIASLRIGPTALLSMDAQRLVLCAHGPADLRFGRPGPGPHPARSSDRQPVPGSRADPPRPEVAEARRFSDESEADVLAHLDFPAQHREQDPQHKPA